MSDNPRLQSVRALEKVYRKGLTLDQVLPQKTHPLVREIVSGTLRHHFSLSERIDELLTRKLRSKDTDIRCLLLIGAYQLLHTRIPDHAAVAETVACVRGLKKPWAKALVNAVLRNLPEQTEEWSPAAIYDHPHWFINTLRNSLPEHWEDVLHANNTRAPMTLRVNSAKTDIVSYKQSLADAHIEFSEGALAETLVLKAPKPQEKLPGFSAGLVAVQDAAAQLAVLLSNPNDNARVLDACAAPGGKGFHLLERNPNINLHMQNNAKARIATLTQQAERLGHSKALAIRHFDSLQARQPANTDQTASGELYDLILLDAPCYGSGTVRRHPDIKVLRDQLDLRQLNHTQSGLLDALWTHIAPNGRLVYSTCSLFQEENDAIIRAFLDRHAGNSPAQRSNDSAQPTPGTTPLCSPQIGDIAPRIPQHASVPGIATEFGWQTLPSEGGGDGLYYCELIAVPN